MSIPYFPMYPTDFEADTSHLTLAEDGAYNRLLRLCWMTAGCSLPDDDAWIMRRMRVDRETFDTVVKVVLDEFFTRENGRVGNARLKKEYERTNEAHKKRVEAGAKGGKAKSLKTLAAASSNATAMPKQPEPEPEPDISKKEDTNVSLQVSPAGDVSEAVRIYNQAANQAGWPSVQKLTPARSRSLKARMADAGGMDGWRHAIERATQSDFLSGRTAKPWTGFGFDWLTKAANFTKLMEGNYDNRTDNRPGTSGPSRKGGDRIFDEIARASGFSQAQGSGGF